MRNCGVPGRIRTRDQLLGRQPGQKAMSARLLSRRSLALLEDPRQDDEHGKGSFWRKAFYRGSCPLKRGEPPWPSVPHWHWWQQPLACAAKAKLDTGPPIFVRLSMSCGCKSTLKGEVFESKEGARIRSMFSACNRGSPPQLLAPLYYPRISSKLPPAFLH